MLDIMSFVADPAKASVIIASLFLSIIALIAWKKYGKHELLYAHLFFVLSPLFYVAFSIQCSMGVLNGLEALCTAALTKLVIYLLPILMAVTFIAGYVLIPLFYKNSSTKLFNKSFNALCQRTDLKANLWLLDKAKPFAFSIGKNVFVSVGMFEILSNREQEAVLLHELYHVKARSSWTKFSSWFVHFFSPLAWFSSCSVAKEEKHADDFAVGLQKTEKYILQAKNKLS